MRDSSLHSVLGRLPLRPGVFAVLASLGRGAAPGITVLEHIEKAGAGARILGPGTLYRLLRELREEGLIERTAAPEGDGESGDERRQYHALTALGRAVLDAEAARLRRTMDEGGLLAPGSGA
jgi:DNA-binding PadR family transcriptional regulator